MMKLLICTRCREYYEFDDKARKDHICNAPFEVAYECENCGKITETEGCCDLA